MKPIRPSLKVMLSLLVLLSVLGTAVAVHVPWFFAARASVSDTVGALNAQIVERTTAELQGNLADAEAALAALRTTLFQRVISVDDVAKREFLFLAYLQSHPSISWVQFGWPDGDFFGAHKVDDDYVQMVESEYRGENEPARRRIDHYSVDAGDIWFERREFLDVPFDAADQPWYRGAMSDTMGDWSAVHTLPVSGRPGISLSTRLTFQDGFVGVLGVSIALAELADFLRGLTVGESGTVFIIDAAERLVAGRDQVGMAAIGDEGQPPRLPPFARSAQAHVEVAAAALAGQGMGSPDVSRTLHFVQRGPRDGEDYFVTFAPLGYFDWVVVTVIPERDFLGGIEESQRRLLVVIAVFIVAMLVLATALSRSLVARPLGSIVARMRRIENFDLGATDPPVTRIREIRHMADALERTARGLAAFQRYLPTQLVRTLISRGIESQPQSRTATILFTDIEGFTTLGEQLTPEQLVRVLNEYFTVVTPAIDEHGGVITQIQGDAILAVYNVPTDLPDHATAAVRTALALQRALAAHAFSDGLVLRSRVGVNTGPVVAGSVGSPERVNYTVHGDAVNTAARLEALNKEHGTRILISASTVALLPAGEFRLRHIGQVPIRGRREGMEVYEVLDAD